jgi:hypothetical protein
MVPFICVTRHAYPAPMARDSRDCALPLRISPGLSFLPDRRCRRRTAAPPHRGVRARHIRSHPQRRALPARTCRRRQSVMRFRAHNRLDGRKKLGAAQQSPRTPSSRVGWVPWEPAKGRVVRMMPRRTVEFLKPAEVHEDDGYLAGRHAASRWPLRAKRRALCDEAPVAARHARRGIEPESASSHIRETTDH